MELIKRGVPKNQLKQFNFPIEKKIEVGYFKNHAKRFQTTLKGIGLKVFLALEKLVEIPRILYPLKFVSKNHVLKKSTRLFLPAKKFLDIKFRNPMISQIPTTPKQG